MCRKSMLALLLVAAGARGDGSECLGCHAADELNGLTLEEIVAALNDPGIPPHRKFAELSEADVREAVGRPALLDAGNQPD